MNITKRILKTYFIIVVICMIISILFLAITHGENYIYKQKKAKLPSTNLSGVIINGYKPDDEVGNIDGQLIKADDGNRYTTQYQEIPKGIKVVSVESPHNIVIDGTLIENVQSPWDGKIQQEVSDLLGDNYLIYKEKNDSSKNIYLYIDHENHLEFRINWYGAKLEKSEKILNLEMFDHFAHSGELNILNFIFDFTMIMIFPSAIKPYYSVSEHIVYPLFVGLYLLPIGLCFSFKNKKMIIITILFYILTLTMILSILLYHASMM